MIPPELVIHFNTYTDTETFIDELSKLLTFYIMLHFISTIASFYSY
jgi:hypothetical protein